MQPSSKEDRGAYARRQTEATLLDEARAIHGTNADGLSQKKGNEFYQGLNRLESAALCLSGGGIRSAAFSLGVVQALASHPRSTPPQGEERGPPCEEPAKCLLSRFHYLSTVSGGGYIGGWLSAWRLRSPFWDAQRPQESIWKCLISRPLGSDQEPSALGWLRSYSNYITPKTGVLSADTWSAIALSVRNIALNWLIILPALCAVVLLLKIVAVLSDWGTRLDGHWQLAFASSIGRGAFQAFFAFSGICLLVFALAFVSRNRPSRRSSVDAGPSQGQFIKRVLIPSFLSALFLAQCLASDYVGEKLLESGDDLTPKFTLPQTVVAGAVCGMAIYAISWFVARVYKHPSDFVLWTIAGGVYGALVALGLYGYIQIPEEGIVEMGGKTLFTSVVLHLVFGVPWIIFSQIITDIVFVGLASYQPNSDADREWLGRAAGWLTVTAIGWFLLTFSVFFGAVLGPQILSDEAQQALKSWATSLAALLGTITAVLGKSSLTSASGDAKGRWPLLTNAALSVVAPLFVAALLIGLSFSMDQLLLGETLVPELFQSWSDEPEPDLSRIEALDWLAIGLAAFLLIAGIASRCVNINRFSLHALYRNRLMRAFLGASRMRHPDRFTGFDPEDNPRVHELWSKRDPNNWRPFHVINMALNVVSSTRLAWQERKAEPFVVTPLHCGSSYLGFRKSNEYGDVNGMSLGTAIAISGAAASPNMGYNSSPAITFLMTMFNVRLGWWLGNPGAAGQRTFRSEGPKWALEPLVDEAFGLTTDEHPYVYLSDGGHFENLGLYEAVRRRCRFVVVVDAGCDPEFKFEDLGNAVRKIQIDHGIPIRLHRLERLRKRAADGSIITADYHAIGEIDYVSADGPLPQGEPPIKNGVILYLKAGYHGTESASVRSYANLRPEFPHETTLNQWFSESQFESYRLLGFEIADGILSDALEDLQFASVDDLETLFNALIKQAKGTTQVDEDNEGARQAASPPSVNSVHTPI